MNPGNPESVTRDSRLSASSWIRSFFLTVLVLAVLLCSAAAFVDPFFRFRVNPSYQLDGTYMCSGLIRNYDYDTLFIGSSMSQNFDMNQVRDELGGKPLHIGIGGLELPELTDLLQLSYRSGHADRYYICADLYYFVDVDPPRHIPAYLCRDDILSTLRYLLSHEVWFHYLPLDAGLVLLNRLGVSAPSSITTASAANIDLLESWKDPYTLGESPVIDNWAAGVYVVSPVDTNGLYERMTGRMDEFFDALDFTAGEHTFFFPPYSSLFWYDARGIGYYEDYLRAKRYFIEEATRRGAIVYDFQAADFTMDLDYYKDYTHYWPEINDWMVERFARGECVVTPKNCSEYEAKLIANTDQFLADYADILYGEDSGAAFKD